MERSGRGELSLTGYMLPITKRTEAAVALVQARLATEDIKLAWTKGPYESNQGTTTHHLLHLTLNW